ncbi:MAG: SDR family oxidoreductase, partial [Brevibacterium sp.]|nr:SDR family oxidoreductase [Brevibacterium sp.]
MEPYLLRNKSALVTGAAQGIGLAIATVLARRGASVGIIDLKGAEVAATSLSQQFPEQSFAGYELDVRDAEAVTAAVGSFVESSGGIDILVNNAGTAARVGIDEITFEQWQRDLETNLGGTFNFIKAAIHPHMLEAGAGAIVNISSISGINGGAVSDGEAGARSGPAYAASKGGIIALTKWVAKEYGRQGIRCNSVAPGPVESALTAGQAYDTSNQALDR